MRELQTGLTIRSGWLSEQGQHAFENFLRPIAEADLRITAVLSDKQRGLFPALQENLQYVYNHQPCEPTGHSHGLPASAINDPQSYRQVISERSGLPGEYCATLGTAANMNNAVIISEKFRELEVVAVCTGGVESNAGRAGDPASVYENDEEFEKLDASGNPVEHGTINTMLFISRELTPRAMVRVVMTATEAKTAVLQELAVNSRYSDGLATGTGTDQISVACMCNTGKPLTSAGKHSKLRELIGKSVYRAIALGFSEKWVWSFENKESA